MTCNSWFSLLSRFDSVIIENDHKFRSFDFEKNKYKIFGWICPRTIKICAWIYSIFDVRCPWFLAGVNHCSIYILGCWRDDGLSQGKEYLLGFVTSIKF